MAPGETAAVDASWETLRDQALEAVSRLSQVSADTRDELVSYQLALEKNFEHLSAGGRASDMTSLFDIPTIRTSFTDRMNEIEQARRACRLSLWRLQLAEGRTIADVARMWGLSWQLVSRALAASSNPNGE